MRVLIVDDETRARARLRRLLSDHADVEVVGEASSGDEAIQQVLTLRPDVAFFDVRMPGRSGIEAARAIHERVPGGAAPLLVFTTAYDDHAVAAFEVQATDYLMKPIERERLADSLRRIRGILWQRQPAAATAPEPTPSQSQHIAGHRAGRVINIGLDDIAVVFVEDTITFVVTPEGKFRLKMPLQAVVQRLPDPPFVRVSRSTIVQLKWVAQLKPAESGTFTAQIREPVCTEIAVSRRRARRLRELLGW